MVVVVAAACVVSLDLFCVVVLCCVVLCCVVFCVVLCCVVCDVPLSFVCD